MSALFDFPSMLVVLLLFITSTTLLRSLYPSIFQKDSGGLLTICWKASRIGERVSPFVSAFCLIMAFHVLFIA